MLKHVFIVNVKEGVSDEAVETRMAELRAMKDKEPGIESITVGRTRGNAGRADAVMMVIDFTDKRDFSAIMKSQTHLTLAAKAGEVFDMQSVDVAQIEY